MKNVVNEVKVARGARVAKIATFAGLGFLVVGLIISLVLQQSPLLLLSLAFLFLGLLVSTIGTANMNRWVREPRADQALVQGLKGFDDRYRLYNYVLPAPHVLLSPAGLYVLTALGQDGVIRYEGDRFHRDFSLGRLLRFMVDEGLGKPFAEADAQVKALHRFLAEHDVDGEVEIQNVVVFYNPRADLIVTDPARPVTNPKGLKRAVRKQQSDKLSSDQYRRLQALFEGEPS
jgi:hypothetical protein